MSDDLIKLTITGRDYELSLPFTGRELHVIKQMSGLRSGEFVDAMEQGDMDLIIAFAHIAVRRTGAPRPSLDELWDLPVGEIVCELPEEDPAEDPTTAPEGAESQPSGSPETIPVANGVPSTAITSVLP